MLNSIIFFDVNCAVWEEGELGELIRLSAIKTDIKGNEHSTYNTFFKPAETKKLDFYSKDKLHISKDILEVSPPFSIAIKFFKVWAGSKPSALLGTSSAFKLLLATCEKHGTKLFLPANYCLDISSLKFVSMFNKAPAMDNVKKMVKFYRALDDNSATLLSSIRKCSDVAEVLGSK